MAIDGGNVIGGMLDPNDPYQTAPTAGKSPVIPAQTQYTGSASIDPSNFMTGLPQRNQAAGGGIGGAAKGALGMGLTGATIGSIVPGVGNLVGAGVGAGVGAISGLLNKHAASAATDYSANDARAAIANAYQMYNGSTATPQQLDQILQGQGWKPGDRFVGSAGLTGVLNNLRSNAQQAQSQTPATPAAATPDSPSAAQAGQYANMLHGFNQDKLNDPNKHDPKYDFAHIAEDYAPTPDGMKQLVQDPRFAATGDKYLGGDTIQLPDGSTVDVGESFGSGGGKGWWWGADDGSGGGASSASPLQGLLSSSVSGPQLSNMNLTNNPNFTPAALMQQLMQQMGNNGK